jgi:hypothetical protein
LNLRRRSAQLLVVMLPHDRCGLLLPRCNNLSWFVASDGSNMAEGFFDLETTGLAPQASLAGVRSPAPAEKTDLLKTDYARAAIAWLPIVLTIGAAAWLLLSDQVRRRADVNLAIVAATPQRSAVTVGLARRSSFNPSISEAIAPEQPATVDGLNISSQSWRRGGLGSNAFVTLTLRNDNDYAVKDVEISCAFARPDGKHLTNRTRLIHDTLDMKSRKTFPRLHVGFVNINAANAKCSILSASRA